MIRYRDKASQANTPARQHAQAHHSHALAPGGGKVLKFALAAGIWSAGMALMVQAQIALMVQAPPLHRCLPTHIPTSALML